jgi:mannose/fructose-specific phosphotransferase system component IIA
MKEVLFIMKLVILSNGNLALSLQQAMQNYFSEPDIKAIGFHYPDHTTARQELRAYLKTSLTRNPDEDFLLLCDCYGSTAFNETALLCRKLRLEEHSLILCGVNLPMVFKLYGLKDSADLALCRSIYDSENSAGICLYPAS